MDLMGTEYVEQREDNYFIRGSRVSLDSVVYGFLERRIPGDHSRQFPHAHSRAVYGAIAFYLGHQAEIDAYLKKRWRHLKTHAARRVTSPATCEPESSGRRNIPDSEREAAVPGCGSLSVLSVFIGG
jgi:hypothetical protein